MVSISTNFTLYYFAGCKNPDEFLCHDVDQCISTRGLCNGYANCPDNSDEINCGRTIEKLFINFAGPSAVDATNKPVLPMRKKLTASNYFRTRVRNLFNEGFNQQNTAHLRIVQGF